MLRPALLPALLLALVSHAAAAQEPGPTGDEAVRVYLDCPGYCDFDYLRTEMPYLSWVRDRADADVHVLVTTQTTGGGGTEFTLEFIGLEEFAGARNVLRRNTPPAVADDERRQELARAIRMGVMPYVAATGAAERIRITYEADGAEGAPAGPVDDPWNYWVFRTSLRGFFNGESSTRFANLFGSLTANRTTEAWKLSVSLDGSFNESRFDTGEEIVESSQESYGLSGLVVKSLTDHWSAGLRVGAEQSTFLNQELQFRAAPAVEYNIYPYAESTRRQLRLLYSIGPTLFDYFEPTIFFQTGDRMLEHELSAALEVRQPWGSINTSLSGSQFLNRTDKYRLSLGGSVNLRLVKGLSLNVFGSASMLRDQIYLAGSGATVEEILLRRKQLQTSYRYFGSIGLSYSFGSIYNNVVNPRFGGSGSGGLIFID